MAFNTEKHITNLKSVCLILDLPTCKGRGLKPLCAGSFIVKQAAGRGSGERAEQKETKPITNALLHLPQSPALVHTPASTFSGTWRNASMNIHTRDKKMKGYHGLLSVIDQDAFLDINILKLQVVYEWMPIVCFSRSYEPGASQKP